MPDEKKVAGIIEQGVEAPVIPEQPEQLERSVETNSEQSVSDALENGLNNPSATVSVPTQPKPIVTASKEPLLVEVEAVLSENIADIYKQLPENKKALFRQTGEHVAVQITQMIKSGIMQIKKVLEWIHTWLKVIPNINSFFLEQEAKIKSDKIKELFDRQHASA